MGRAIANTSSCMTCRVNFWSSPFGTCLAMMPVIIIIGAFGSMIYFSGQKYVKKYTALAQGTCDPGTWTVTHSYWNGKSQLSGKIDGASFIFTNDDHGLMARSAIFIPYPVSQDYELQISEIIHLPPEWTAILKAIQEKSLIKSLAVQTGRSIAHDPNAEEEDDRERMLRRMETPLMKINQPGLLLTYWAQRPFNAALLRTSVTSLNQLAPLAAHEAPLLQDPRIPATSLTAPVN